MQLIDNGTQINVLQLPVDPVGTPGYAYNGPPGQGTPETIFDPDMANTLIAELANVVQAVTDLDRNSRNQLLYAIQQLHGGGVKGFYNSEVWHVPNNVYFIDVQLWGGGAGSFASYGSLCSGGGAAGGYARCLIAVTPGQTFNVTIGAGGNAGAVGGGWPSSGGSSICAGGPVTITAGGGQLNSLSTTTYQTDFGGGPGGTANFGDLTIQGSSGTSGDARWPGMGGAAPFGGSIGAGTYGVAGIFPGGGAAGAGFLGGAPQPGGAGAKGFCLIRW